jgi:hypothetical protein
MSSAEAEAEAEAGAGKPDPASSRINRAKHVFTFDQFPRINELKADHTRSGGA